MSSSTTSATPEIVSLHDDHIEAEAPKSIYIDENPIKGAIRYHVNWGGLPLTLLAVGYYGFLIYKQVLQGVPEDFEFALSAENLLSLRYLGSFLYFLGVLLYPPFIFELRNAEAPILLSTVMQLHYESIQKPVGVMEMVISSAVLLLCFLRRLPYWRCFLNPWTKDKSELKRLIALARQATLDL